ncbi:MULTISPECIES: hypothetical protein [Clostridium]|uniref:Uncharacterized protein n=1 Tax=Clostridium frigoriphilum TaxID=443253 RepID=A0ABU7UVS0_9CLOT|nr:hypothetical protein [Clostridium sp. DSM 17811]MBU3102376.1 hypothetical protein [Clostridium sp. DSM 17811]
MKPRNMIGLFLTIGWFYFIVFFCSKYYERYLNTISYFIITTAILYIGGEIIAHFTPNKK